MILAHLIVGVMPVDNSHFSWFFFFGSILPDIDHPYVLLKHHIFKWAKIVDSMEHERKYHIHYRTPYFHSFLGAAILSALVFYVDIHAGWYFLAGYLGHLILDWPDIDEKQYLYPFKIKFKGFLPVLSTFEKIFTTVLALLLIYMVYFYKYIDFYQIQFLPHF